MRAFQFFAVEGNRTRSAFRACLRVRLCLRLRETERTREVGANAYEGNPFPPHRGIDLGEKNHITEAKELVLDGGFSVPETNAFGQTFRDYNAESERKKTVEAFYRANHSHQSYAFVKRMREEYGKLNRVEMSIWECIELLNEFVDDSDPDLDEPQIEHLLQTAEAIRKDYPNEDWLHLTGLIHDLGKVLLHPSFGELPQWAVVGDTFPVGCAFDESNVHLKFFEGNADYYNPGVGLTACIARLVQPLEVNFSFRRRFLQLHFI